MAYRIETKITEGLFQHLGALTFSPAIDIAWPIETFEPDGIYLRPSVLPAEPRQIVLGPSGENRHSGVLQVSVFVPDGIDIRRAMEIAGAVADHFRRGTQITREGVLIQILQPPGVGAALDEPGWTQIPVSIRYQADAPNPE